MRANIEVNEPLPLALERPLSLVRGRDSAVIPLLLEIHAVSRPIILDCCANKGVMWKGTGFAPTTMDIDPTQSTDHVGDFTAMPFPDDSFDVVAFDPPHLPNANASNDRTTGHADVYGVRVQNEMRSGDNINQLFAPFLSEAARVLRPDGVVIAKLSDFVHNHRYQWHHVDFIQAARQIGMTPCDVVIKADPAASNLQSSKWRNVKHFRRAHCYWIVVRNGSRCEAS